MRKGGEDVSIAQHELYQRLGRSDDERQSAYRQLFRAQVSKADVDAIRDATNKGWALQIKSSLTLILFTIQPQRGRPL